MTVTEAVAGSGGTMLGVLNANVAKQWIAASPIALLEKLGPRLSKLDNEYYRVSFQLVDSRLAALLLELAGDAWIVKGLSQAELGELIGIYRESVTSTLSAMESHKLIKVSRRKVTLLDKQGLKELSEY
jgi:CRP-like cAMP-binding protein